MDRQHSDIDSSLVYSSKIMHSSELGLEDILDAESRLKDIVRRTPLVPAQHLPELYYKTESLQAAGSFKLRAAFNQIAILAASEKTGGGDLQFRQLRPSCRLRS